MSIEASTPIISPKQVAGKPGNTTPQRRVHSFVKQTTQPKDSVRFGMHTAHAATGADSDHTTSDEPPKPTTPKQEDDSFLKKLVQPTRWKAAAKVGWAAAADKSAIWSDVKWSSILALVTCWMAGAQIIFIPIITATGFMFRAVTGALQGFQHPELADQLATRSQQSGEAQAE